MTNLAFGFESKQIGHSLVIQADCFEWLAKVPENTLHSVVTDPPYGVKEYEPDQLEKRTEKKLGVWRLPPAFDGHERSPLPRFTALSPRERAVLKQFFVDWSRQMVRALRPGGHIFLASNAYLSQLVFSALIEGGLEFRGELIRLVGTFRGGDRPKNAETEFPDVSSLPRGAYEPWGIFRKPLLPKMKLSDCLREFQTGGLRRLPDGRPFSDVIESGRTSQQEKAIANHPSLKPQAFLRQLVYVSLPLGEGIVLDPFMGSGSTVAAAEAINIRCIGIERLPEFYEMSLTAIPQLAQIPLEGLWQQPLLFK